MQTTLRPIVLAWSLTACGVLGMGTTRAEAQVYAYPPRAYPYPARPYSYPGPVAYPPRLTYSYPAPRDSYPYRDPRFYAGTIRSPYAARSRPFSTPDVFHDSDEEGWEFRGR